MSAFDDFEREYLEANPHARSASYVPTAPAAAPVAPSEPEMTDAELAEAAAFALSDAGRRMDPHAAAAVWAERVRRAERAMAEAGEVQPAGGAQSVAVGVPVNEADWATVNALAATVSPITGRRYVDELGADGQHAREALFHARAAVLRGEPLPAELLAQVRAGIAADQAAADKAKAAKDAADLADFRERRR